MDAMRGQGGLQMLLSAEQDAQQIVAAARNLKMARLRQAKEETEREVANYRSSGSSDSTMRKLEAETEEKIQKLKETVSKVSPDIVVMLLKHIATLMMHVRISGYIAFLCFSPQAVLNTQAQQQ